MNWFVIENFDQTLYKEKFNKVLDELKEKKNKKKNITNWSSIFWSPELSLFVTENWGVEMISPDGVNWTDSINLFDQRDYSYVFIHPQTKYAKFNLVLKQLVDYVKNYHHRDNYQKYDVLHKIQRLEWDEKYYADQTAKNFMYLWDLIGMSTQLHKFNNVYDEVDVKYYPEIFPIVRVTKKSYYINRVKKTKINYNFCNRHVERTCYAIAGGIVGGIVGKMVTYFY